MSAPTAQLRWDLLSDIRQVLEFPFMRHALEAATATAVVAAVAGWFVVARRQTFAAHTLSVVAFPGAAGAAWLGVAGPWGYFGACLASAAVLGWRPAAGAAAEADGPSAALIGVVQAGALALGYVFSALYGGFLSGIEGLLFGTFLGVTSSQVVLLAAVALVGVAGLAAIGRPLLLATLQPEVAAAEGVPVRALGVAWLLLLGAVVAAVSEVTGALLVFALLVMPPAAAARLTARPLAGIASSVAFGVAAAWIGLAASYFSPYPPGFFITTVAFACFAAASVWARR